MKDHEIALTVNKLRDLALVFHDHQSLRGRIAEVIVDPLKRIQELEADLAAVVGEFQRLQPGGSPPPGGPVVLARWIRLETAELIAGLKRGESICPKCGIRKDDDYPKANF